MNGSLELTEGLIAVGVPDDSFMDAAITRTGAGVPGDEGYGGVEIELGQPASVDIGPRSDYKAALTLSLDIKPAKMRELGLLLLSKTGAPAFNEIEWRIIRESIDRDLIARGAPREQVETLVVASNAIREAYS